MKTNSYLTHLSTDTHASFLIFANVMAEITQKYGIQTTSKTGLAMLRTGQRVFCVLLELIFPRPLPGLGCSDPEAMRETTAIVPVFLDDRGLDYSHTAFASEPYPNHCFHHPQSTVFT